MADYISEIQIGDGERKPIRDEEAVRSSELFDLVYPVGAIYMSVKDIDPEVLFGGEWEPIGDTFLMAAGSTYPAGTTGGSPDAVVPTHTHPASGSTDSSGNHAHTANSSGAHTHTTSSSGAHHHNMGGKIWSSGAGRANAYIMTANRNTITRNTQDAGAHTHSVNSGGAHTHSTTTNGAHTHSVNVTVSSSGVEGAGKNIPPYLAVYVWKRTA